MMRRLLTALFLTALACGVTAWADSDSSKGKKDPPAELKGDLAIPVQSSSIQVAALKRSFETFRQKLAFLAGRLENGSDKDKEKAKALRAALKMASEQGTEGKFEAIVRGLSTKGADKNLDILAQVIRDNSELRKDLQRLIAILSRDETQSNKEQMEKTARLLEQLKELIAKQERVRAQTEIGRKNNKELEKDQNKVTKETKEVADGKKGEQKDKAESKGEAKSEGKEGKEGKAEAKNDVKTKSDSKPGESKNENKEGKESKNNESKEGAGKETKPGEAKGTDGKESKAGEAKEGKGADGKPSTENKPGENKTGESKEGKPGESKEGKEGKAGESKESKEGKASESKEGKPGDGKESKPGDGKGGESKEGKPGDGKEGKSGESKEGKGGDGKEGKSGENKEGKSGDNKPGQGKENKPGDGKSENKPGKVGENKEGKPSAGQPGDGKPGQGKENKPSENKSGMGKAGEGKDGKASDGKGGKPGEAKRPSPSGESKSGEAKSGSKSGEPKSGEGKPSGGKPGEGKKGEGKPSAGKPGEGKKGESKGQGQGKGEGKPGQPSEPKPGSPGSKPGSGKPGSGKPSSGKPGQGKPSEGSQGQQQEQQQSDNPVKKQIEDANKYQKQAEIDLDKNKRDDAADKQTKAIKELEAAKKKLEDLLRQMREEEIERLLADLEKRCSYMLALQREVRDGTVTLDTEIGKEPEQKPTLGQASRVNKLGDKEEEILREAAMALKLIRTEGSAVAFAEVFEQVSKDMENIATRLRRVNVDKVTQTIENDVIETLIDMIKALQKAQRDNKSKPSQSKPSQSMPQDQKLIDQLAELKMIYAMQRRVNARTELYGKQYKGEQLLPPATASAEKEKKQFEMIQGELKDLSSRQEKIGKVTKDIATGKNEAK